MKVLHIFAMYETPVGYSTRSRNIVRFQRSFGVNVEYVSVEDQIKFSTKNLHKISYLMELLRDRIKYSSEFKKLILSKITKFNPDIIHVHSPWKLGVDVINSLKKYKIQLPIIFEVRGLWEETAISLGRSRYSLNYLTSKKAESFVIKHFKIITAISEHLKAYLITKGADKRRVFVVPNGVDTDYFKPLPKNTDMLKSLGLSGDSIVLGFIGSIREIEGLETLIEAVGYLRRRRPIDDLKVVIIGKSDTNYLNK